MLIDALNFELDGDLLLNYKILFQRFFKFLQFSDFSVIEEFKFN